VEEAESLIASLPGVLSARVVEVDGGGVGDIHVLTSAEVAAKQTVRNVESALLAHFGVRVDHRKISVATTTEGARMRPAARPAATVSALPTAAPAMRRVTYEDLEVRRSARGAWCKVTLRRGEETIEAEAESATTERATTEELAARATISALRQLSPDAAGLALEGAQVVTAFGREFVFVGVTARQGRGTALLTGSAEIRDEAETAAALAVLDATNRWVGRGR
jgi:hypothetical protein